MGTSVVLSGYLDSIDSAINRCCIYIMIKVLYISSRFTKINDTSHSFEITVDWHKRKAIWKACCSLSLPLTSQCIYYVSTTVLEKMKFKENIIFMETD